MFLQKWPAAFHELYLIYFFDKRIIRLCIHVICNRLIPDPDKMEEINNHEPDEVNPPLLLRYQIKKKHKTMACPYSGFVCVCVGACAQTLSISVYLMVVSLLFMLVWFQWNLLFDTLWQEEKLDDFFSQWLLPNSFFPHDFWVKGFYVKTEIFVRSFSTCTLLCAQTSSYLITSVINPLCVFTWCTQCVEHIFVRPCHLSQLFFKTCFFQKSLILVFLPSLFHPNLFHQSRLLK